MSKHIWVNQLPRLILWKPSVSLSGIARTGEPIRKGALREGRVQWVVAISGRWKTYSWVGQRSNAT